MSEALHTDDLIPTGGNTLPPAIKEVYVRSLIETLREVAREERDEKFVSLPMLFEDNIDLAYTITGAEVASTIYLDSGRKIVYHKGRYEGEGLEFAMRYEDEEEQPSAWGVRRTDLEARRNPHVPALKLPAAALDVFVTEVLEDINNLDVVSGPYRMAA